ncbi:hypothetical protein N7495_005634 [Penicillium taxi]|uniref:uncharacterized protein n=1 Tax=Penicillium taxi TaxID=168475 RepID=UPI0025459386|nr:uncharacterized protein N7495_005634 [Penicillium taxi]KAJ5893943.1 hypothetical protein N7495_005634 [Penicillium taxi]
MAFTTQKLSLMTRVVLALLAVSSACAFPIQGSNSEMQTQPVANIQPRDPRIIPNTENYLASILNEVGLGPPPKSELPAPEIPSPPVSVPVPVPFYFPTPTVEISDHGNGNVEGLYPSPAISSYESSWTTNVQNDSDHPVKNIQIGDWHGGNKIEASDIPNVLNAVEKLVSHRLNDIYSADEISP